MSSNRYRRLAYAACALAGLHAAGAAAADAASDHRRLQIEQQQDALNLDLQHSLRARRQDLGSADARRLDQLQLQQRLELQQLEQHQLQRDYLLRHHSPSLPNDAIERRSEAQRELFAQERQLQIQRFEMDRHRLLQSMPRQPLQPPTGAAQLTSP